LAVLSADQQSVDLKDQAIDLGYAPKEGFWSAKFIPAKPGLYMVAHSLDTLHRTTRAIKSGKTFFLVSDSLDKVAVPANSFDQPVGNNLELVPSNTLVAPMGPGKPISVCLMYQGKPLPKARVTFIPRGTVLTEGFDENYERMTDAEGLATFTPTEGNYVLVVAHHAEPEQRGEGYDRTSYSATLTVYVPELCTCCE